MADPATNPEVTPEAYQRVLKERDEARGQVKELSGTLKTAEAALTGFQLRDKAYEHFAGKADGDRPHDPFGVASMAVNDATLRGLDDEALPGALDDWHVKMRSLAAPPAAQDTGSDGDAPPPPVPRAAGPSPAGDGAPHTAEPLTVIEWQKQNPNASIEQYKAARQQGLVAPATR